MKKEQKQQVIPLFGQGSTEIRKINKNFFDNSGLKNGLWYSGGKIVGNSSGWYVCFRVIGGKTYYISKKNGKTQNSNLTLYACTTEVSPKQGVDILDTWTVSTGEYKELEYSTSENARYLFLGLAAGNSSVITEEIRNLAIEGLQVEIGNTKTDYVEHEQTNYILDIQQEMLTGDYFELTNSGWEEVHGFGKYIFTGLEEYIKSPLSSEEYLRSYIRTSIVSNMKTNGKMLTTRYKDIGMYNASTIGNRIACSPQFHTQISVEYLEENTAEAYKALLAKWKTEGNPLVAFYELATPTKLACTEEQSAVLEELSNLDLFEGVNNIITVEDIALLKLKYVADTKMYLENYINSKIAESEN